jgi:hypothetical protein
MFYLVEIASRCADDSKWLNLAKRKFLNRVLTYLGIRSILCTCKSVYTGNSGVIDTTKTQVTSIGREIKR